MPQASRPSLGSTIAPTFNPRKLDFIHSFPTYVLNCVAIHPYHSEVIKYHIVLGASLRTICSVRRTGTTPFPRGPICTLPPRPLSGNLLGSPSINLLCGRADLAMLHLIIRPYLQIRRMMRAVVPNTAHQLHPRLSRQSQNGGACACFEG